MRSSFCVVLFLAICARWQTATPTHMGAGDAATLAGKNGMKSAPHDKWQSGTSETVLELFCFCRCTANNFNKQQTAQNNCDLFHLQN